jgi:hypothetical protein
MVQPDSDRIPRDPSYSGVILRCISISPKGLSPTVVQFPNCFGYSNTILTRNDSFAHMIPLPPVNNACQLLHSQILGSSRFARRYFGNRVYFLFLRVMRWFSSPRMLPYWMIPRYRDRVAPFGYLRV